MYLCGVSDQIKQHRSQEDDQMVGVDTLIGKTLDQFEIDDQLAAVFCVLNENIRLTVDMEVSVCLAK